MPKEPEKPIVHFGVKGMRWGVRKKDDTGGESTAAKPIPKSPDASGTSGSTPGITYKQPSAADKALTKKYQSLPEPKLTKAEQSKNLLDSQKKSIDKLDASGDWEFEPPPKGLTAEQKKKLVYLGLGAVAVGGLMYMSNESYKRNYSVGELGRNLDGTPNKQSKESQFQDLVNQSKRRSWTTGYIKQQSWDREEFELPVGHTFNRISRHDEKTFGTATYATHSKADFDRYVVGFRGEIDNGNLRHVTFKATAPIKVPNLATTIETLRESMSSDLGRNVSPSEATRQYKTLSGGKWDDPTSQNLFKALQAKGYGALVDEMDAGVIGDTPLVLFNHDIVGPKSSVPMTDARIRASENAVTEIPNRK